MDPLNPMASTLDPAIAQIYQRANAVKQELRDSLTAEQKATSESELTEEERVKSANLAKLRHLVRRILETPARIRQLVADGMVEEAQDEWEPALKILEKWKSEGKGGPDVQECIDEGEAALRG